MRVQKSTVRLSVTVGNVILGFPAKTYMHPWVIGAGCEQLRPAPKGRN
jgi:hypothetical protein